MSGSLSPISILSLIKLKKMVLGYCSTKKVIRELFHYMGFAVTIEYILMEAATVLGTCGIIACVLRFTHAMIQGGIQIGFVS
jgi:pyrroline-5-carboxylate reductase